MTGLGKMGVVMVLVLAVLARPGRVLAKSLVAPDGHQRQYQIFIPEPVKGHAAPVLFVLHGGGGSAAQVHRHWSFDAQARRAGFVVVYPDGINRHWNDGRTGGSKKLFRQTPPDDVGFLRALAKKLVADGTADAARLYVTGVSNGGMMTQALACDASAVFAGFASLIAGLPAARADCRPERARPVLMINGDADPLMPWQGGGVGFRGQRGQVLSGPKTFAHWQAVLGCTDAVQRTDLSDPDKTDGARPRQWRATGCSNGVAVQMVRVLGGGHAVPGAPYRRKRLRRLLGHDSKDFDARDMVVRFFGL